MANEQNLKPFSELTESEQREIRRKGGQASGEARRKKRSMEETMRILLSMSIKEGDVPDIEEIQSIAKLNGLNVDMETALLMGQLNKAVKKQDTRAAEFVRDTSGQKPTDKVEQLNTNINIDFGDLNNDND